MHVTKEKKEENREKEYQTIGLSEFSKIAVSTKRHTYYYHISFIVEKKLNSFTIVFCEGLFCLMRNIIDSVE